LERVCNKTEFEVEGWRKIPPLMEMLEKNIDPTVISKMKLVFEPLSKEPIISTERYKEASNTFDFTKLIDNDRKSLTIRDTEIYKHFTTEATKHIKIAIYVNSIVPINKNMNCLEQIMNVGNHCVVVKGIIKWPLNDPNGKDCLELENNGGCDQTRFIPIDFPVFEEVQVKVMKIFRVANGAVDRIEKPLNRYGRQLAEIKWGKNIENNWYDIKKETKKDGSKVADEEKCKYGMLFVRGIHPSFKLKFTS